MNTTIALGLGLILIIVILVLVMALNNKPQQILISKPSIENMDQPVYQYPNFHTTDANDFVLYPDNQINTQYPTLFPPPRETHPDRRKRCFKTGCSKQICADRPIRTTCENKCEYNCYRDYANCNNVDGDCKWSINPRFVRCIQNCKQPNCIKTGCSGQICADKPTASTCEYKCEYDCYKYANCNSDNIRGKCQWQTNSQFDRCVQQCKNPNPNPEIFPSLRNNL